MPKRRGLRTKKFCQALSLRTQSEAIQNLVAGIVWIACACAQLRLADSGSRHSSREPADGGASRCSSQ